MISPIDISSQSVLQFAVEQVKVSKIIVCGHYDCKGIQTGLTSTKVEGPVKLWINQVIDLKVKYAQELNKYKDFKQTVNKFVELNIIEQVHNITRNERVKQAMKERDLKVYGLVYCCSTGRLSKVEVPEDEFEHLY